MTYLTQEMVRSSAREGRQGKWEGVGEERGIEGGYVLTSNTLATSSSGSASHGHHNDLLDSGDGQELGQGRERRA